MIIIISFYRCFFLVTINKLARKCWDKGFKINSDLKVHMRSHTKEKEMLGSHRCPQEILKSDTFISLNRQLLKTLYRGTN